VLTLGLHVRSKDKKRVIHGVILDADGDSVVAVIKHIPDDNDDVAAQSKEAHAHLLTAIKGKAIAAAVLFEGDWNQNQRLTTANKERLRLEGVALAAIQSKIDEVAVMNGPALGRACSSDKASAIAAGKKLGVPAAAAEAAAAAVAAKSLLQSVCKAAT
jgi:hypothetical protein